MNAVKYAFLKIEGSGRSNQLRKCMCSQIFNITDRANTPIVQLEKIVSHGTEVLYLLACI